MKPAIAVRFQTLFQFTSTRLLQPLPQQQRPQRLFYELTQAIQSLQGVIEQSHCFWMPSAYLKTETINPGPSMYGFMLWLVLFVDSCFCWLLVSFWLWFSGSNRSELREWQRTMLRTGIPTKLMNPQILPRPQLFQALKVETKVWPPGWIPCQGKKQLLYTYLSDYDYDRKNKIQCPSLNVCYHVMHDYKEIN